MRPGLDATTAALYASGAFDLHWKVLAANGSGTMVDVSDRLTGVSQVLPNPNTPIGSLTLTLVREPNDDTGESLAPFVEGSSLNRLDDDVTYAALLEIGRVGVAYVALTAHGGARPADGSTLWYEQFRGAIAGVDWPTWEGGDVTVRLNDQSGALQKTKSETAHIYPAGTAIETVIQQVLTNHGFVVTLRTPVATGAVLSNDYAPGLQKTVWEQVWGLAQSIGWVLWWRPTSRTVQRLTLFEPDRSAS